MSSRQEEKEQRKRERLERERAAESEAKRKRLLQIVGGTVVAAVVVVGVVLALAGGGGDSDRGDDAGAIGPGFGSMTSLPGVLTGPPPWPANGGELQRRLRAIGLDPLSAEGQVVHTHQHLDLFVEGRRVTVPENIGIDPSGEFLAALHTHDDSGIMHVESPTATSYSLGQFFAVWGVRLDARCIGGRCAGGAKRLRVWVNGKAVTTDPTRIVLDEHQVIVLAYGTAAQEPDPVPSSHDFAAVGL